MCLHGGRNNGILGVFLFIKSCILGTGYQPLPISVSHVSAMGYDDDCVGVMHKSTQVNVEMVVVKIFACSYLSMIEAKYGTFVVMMYGCTQA